MVHPTALLDEVQYRFGLVPNFFRLASGSPEIVRTAHFWTKVHPELTFEDDLKELFAIHEELAECVLNDPEAETFASSQELLDELAEVVRIAVEATRPFIEEASHELIANIPDQPHFLDADPHRLAQVFSNLLNNAAKYTPEAGRIVLNVERAGGEVVVSVEDNGINDTLPRGPRDAIG